MPSARIAAVASLLLFLVPAFLAGPVIAGPSPVAGPESTSSITINSVDQHGNPIVGYQTTLYNSNGQIIEQGYAPTTFNATGGQTYMIGAASYGSCVFASWSDGVASNPRTFTAESVSPFTAVYDCSYGPRAATSSAFVESVNQVNAAIMTYYIAYYSSNMSIASFGPTPSNFTMTVGTTYAVQAENYGNCTFSNWSDQVTTNPMNFTATGSTTVLTAVYQCSSVYPKISTVTIRSIDQYGVGIAGYRAVITDPMGKVVSSGFTPGTFNTTDGQTYYATIDNYGSCTFVTWSDGITRQTLGFLATSADVSFTAEFYCASGTMSHLTVNAVNQVGDPMTGYLVTLSYEGSTNGTENMPATYNLVIGYTYQVVASANGSCTFSNWSVTDTNAPVSFTPSSTNQTLTAVFDCNNGGPNSVTVYAHRMPAGYWADCFATVCAAGTGPGATMFFALSYSNGTLVSTGFASEDGYTFTGLTPGATYILQADDCDSCHGSTHDVLFNHWGDGSTTDPIQLVAGSALDAWFNCTNGCGGY